MGVWAKTAGVWKQIGVDAVGWGVATGGTETTFVGNGSNGESGKTYKVCKFDTNGNFVVTKAGFFEVVVCGAGGGGEQNPYMGPGGGAGQMIPAATKPMKVWLEAGTYPAVIGVGGLANQGQVSSWTGFGGKTTFAGLTAAGGAPGGDYANPGRAGACGSGGASAGVNAGGIGLVGGNGEVSEPTPAKGSGGGMGGNAAAGVPGPGISNDITGTAVEYCKGGLGTTTGTGVVAPAANTGTGGAGGKEGNTGPTAGSNGVVIARFQTA